MRLYDLDLVGGTVDLTFDVSRFDGDTLRFQDFDIVFLDNTGWAAAAIHPLQVGAVYQDLDNGAASGNRLHWVSLGARPTWHASRYFSVELEAGFDHTRRADGPDGSLLKVTLAPQLTPKAAALSRPSIRAYATWARWSDDFVGLVAPVNYGDSDHGWAVGVQLETWW